MKNKKLTILFFLLCLICFSQNKQLLYNFNEIPQSLLLNPSTELRGTLYVGVPFLSGIHANIGSSGFTPYDLFAPDNVNFNNKLRELIFSTSSKDVITSNIQIDIISGGFESKSPFDKIFYSFGIYQEIDFFMRWPKDLAILAYDGNANYIGKPFNLSHLAVEAEMLTVYHFGISKKINKKFTLGGRAKIYSGAYNVNSTKNNGRFITALGTNNIYTHNVDAELRLQSSGFPTIDDDETDEDYDAVSHLKKSMLFGGNLGLGFDFGFTYHHSDRVIVSGSVLDVGFIRQTKQNQNYSFEGTHTFEGFEFLFPEVVDVDGQLNDYWENLKDELDESYSEDTNAYTTWRPIKINAGFEYSFGSENPDVCDCLLDDDPYLNSLGGHLFIATRPRGPLMALTGFYSRRISNFLNTKVTYTIDKFSFTNIGLGVSFNYANFNFYTLADNLLSYQNLADANSLSVQFGLNYMMQ